MLTGSPIRKELLSGNRLHGLTYCHFKPDKPVILIIGGSSGSQFINEVVRSLLPELLQNYQVLHLCGKGNLDTTLNNTAGYAQLEYANQELSDLFAAADIVISRAGANAICELLALRKPNILIPLSANASRGDQILNARSFERQGYSIVIEEEQLSNVVLSDAIHKLFENRSQYTAAMAKSEQLNSVETVVQLIEQIARKQRA